MNVCWGVQVPIWGLMLDVFLIYFISLIITFVY